MAGLLIDPTALRHAAAGAAPKAQAEAAAQQFEAMLLKELVKHAVPKMEESGMGG